MNLLKVISRMYWKWVVDCCTDDIHELEESLNYLNNMEFAHASRELAEVRKILAHAELQIERWS